VVLLEQEDALLPQFPGEIRAHAGQVLERRNVDVRLATAVVGLAPGRLELAGGAALEVDLALWAGGERPGSLALPQPPDPGQAPVDEFLRLWGHPHVFVAGRAAWVQPTGPLAFDRLVQSGTLAAKNLLASMTGRAPERFQPASDVVSTTLGRHEGAALAYGVLLRGLAAWTLDRARVLRALPRLSQSLGVLGAWASDAFLR
jgi:NADH dehydrogenase